MNPFEFTSVGKIIFGRGKIAQLGELASGLGSAALVIHNGDDPGRDGFVDRAAASLASAGLRVCFHRQRGEPTIACVDAALAIAREQKCDLLIGLGGGSAIDCAKATAGLLTNGGQCLDYMEVIGKGQKISKPAAPWIAIPTTAGTGAEVTKNAVIGSPEHKFKASIRSDHLLARVALVDPELHVNSPPEVTAASGMDALCQCIEAYTSNGSNPMSDAIAEAGANALFRSLEAVFHDGGNLEARGQMAFGALCSGVALTNAGLGAVHGFAAPLGANFPVPHGVVCARLLPEVLEANIRAMTVNDWQAGLGKYRRLGAEIAHVVFEDARYADLPKTYSEIVVAYTHRLIADLRIPPLAQFGMRPDDIAEMVSLAKKTSSMRYNPVVLADDVLANILRSALQATNKAIIEI